VSADSDLEHFRAGVRHALDTARDNPDFRPIACAIVEDWVRSLAGPAGGIDVSIRNHGRRIVGLWHDADHLAHSSSLYETLVAYQQERERAAKGSL